MTIAIRVRHDSPDTDKMLRVRLYERLPGRFNGASTVTVISTYFIEPGSEETIAITNNRFIETDIYNGS